MKRTAHQDLIHTMYYAKYIASQQRRETWKETVDRYIDFIKDATNNNKMIPYGTIGDAIYEMECMPSMRGLFSAGKSARKDNSCLYNCAYLPVDNISAFPQILFKLMCGSGVGFSVERKFIEQLPVVPKITTFMQLSFVVDDSREGWADALYCLISNLYQGKCQNFDFSLIRPAGAPLKTFGGKASGPEPLFQLFEYIKFVFYGSANRRLTSIEVHSIVCMIASIVQCGSTRRASLISFSDLDDQLMRNAKAGKWLKESPHLRMANNSAVYHAFPGMEEMRTEWQSMIDSRSGERGIFNLQAAIRKCLGLGRDIEDPRTNPCGEVILPPSAWCNVSCVILRRGDSYIDIRDKVRIASILGTIQSGFTHFPYLSKYTTKWTENAVNNPLLGVGFSNIWAVPKMCGRDEPENLPRVLKSLRDEAHATNREYAKILGINPSKAITTIKPSGNTSQLTNCASGIHPGYGKEYLRTLTIQKDNPLCSFLQSQGVYTEDSVYHPGKEIKAYFYYTEDCVTQDDVSAIEQLSLYYSYQMFFSDHNISCTVHMLPHEQESVFKKLCENWNDTIGVTFFPKEEGGHIYPQAPYQPVTNVSPELLAKIKATKVDMTQYRETTDNTSGGLEYACTGGQCEIV